MVIKLPPQGSNVMSSEELASTQETGQQIVLINLIASRLLKQILAMVFGSILVVQILAHVPLADIFMPANVLQPF